jgi:hypothetical protein
MEYRKVSRVELHDSRVMLAPKDQCYAFTSQYGCADGPRKPAYKIDLGDLRMLFSALSIEMNERVLAPYLSHQNFAQKRSEVNDVELNIYQHYHETADGAPSNEDIVSVECAVIDSRMVNIRIISKTDGETYISEMTHVGTFTIWWQVEP